MKLRSIFVRTSRFLKSQRFGFSPSCIYTDGFYRDAVDRHEAQSAAAVIDTICEVFRPASIFDIGCGNGIYLHAAARKGIVAAGCDGSEAGVRLCPSDVFVFQHDLRKPLKLNRRFGATAGVAVRSSFFSTAGCAFAVSRLRSAPRWVSMSL